jgi:hypothetical protein
MRREYNKNWIANSLAQTLSNSELERNFILLGYNVPSNLSKEQLIEYGFSNGLIVDFSSRGRKPKEINNNDIIAYVRKQLKDMDASSIINSKDINITITKNNIQEFLCRLK